MKHLICFLPVLACVGCATVAGQAPTFDVKAACETANATFSAISVPGVLPPEYDSTIALVGDGIKAACDASANPATAQQTLETVVIPKLAVLTAQKLLKE